MSRAHMLYDNKPLQSIPVTAVRWEKQWNMDEIFRCQRQSGISQGGILIEGVIRGRSRFSVSDIYTRAKKWRYVVLHVEILRAIRRKYDSSGKEIEPNFGDTTKVSTGYLMSSYKTYPVDKSDKLSPSDVIKETTVTELHKIAESQSAGYKNCVSFWSEEKDLEKMELAAGDNIRLRTRGTGPYIDAIVKLDNQSSTVSNYSGGEGTGASWTNKVMSYKDAQAIPQDEQEGADDDEWDD